MFFPPILIYMPIEYYLVVRLPICSAIPIIIRGLIRRPKRGTLSHVMLIVPPAPSRGHVICCYISASAYDFFESAVRLLALAR